MLTHSPFRVTPSVVTALCILVMAFDAGAASPPYRLDDINLESAGSSPGNLRAMSDGIRVFFTACDDATGCELYLVVGVHLALVKDINPGRAGSFPQSLTDVDGTLFFRACEPATGCEVWKSDGTEEGTVLVKDVNPGPASSITYLYGDLLPQGSIYGSGFGALPGSGLLFFAADDGSSGRELWVSDGSAAGTTLLKDIKPGPASSLTGFDKFGALGGTMFFAADDGTNGNELWRSGGTAATTMLAQDINPIAGLGSHPRWFTALGSTLFFSADDGTIGQELWKTTGGAATLVKDISSGGGSDPDDLTAVGGTLFFVADDSPSCCNHELWKSDGTTAGTVMVKDISPGLSGSFPNNLVDNLGTLYFTAYDPALSNELWRSDGTPGGTYIVRDIAPGSDYSFPFNLTSLNGTLFFTAQDDLNGRELWKTDGTEGGTVVVRDIRPGAAGSMIGDSFSTGIVAVGAPYGWIYFVADDGVHGAELWTSVGSAYDTRMVADLNGTSTHGSGAGSFTLNAGSIFSGIVYFTADDGFTGRELWATTGDRAFLVRDINPGGGWSDVRSLTYGYPSTVFFSAVDGLTGRELWKVTDSGATLVKDIRPGPIGSEAADFGELVDLLGLVVFPADDGTSGRELWASDGTTGGTTLLKDIRGGAASSSPGGIVAAPPLAFFRADDGVNGVELWKTDGTGPGTTLVKDIAPGPGGSTPQELFASYGGAFFSADDGTNGRELWLTDGSPGGTVLIKNINPTGSSNPYGLFGGAGLVYFQADDGSTGRELWRSDGTPGGTVLVADINPGPAGSLSFDSNGRYTEQVFGANMTADAFGRVYFAADDGVHGVEIWRTEFAGGAVMLRDINPGSDSSFPRDVTFFDDRIYFNACEPRAGCELWQTDGTTAGTRLVADLNQGSSHSYPDALTSFGGVLYFDACAGLRGAFTLGGDCEPWVITTTCPVTSKATLKIGKLKGPVGDESVTASGTVTGPSAPVIYPYATNVHFVVTDSAGGRVIDVTIPAGAIAAAGGAGWSRTSQNADGETWRYTNKAGFQGITQIIWKRAGTTYTFKIKGKKGSFALAGANLPLQATFVYGSMNAGQCADFAFSGAPACRASSSTVVCK